MLCLQSSIHEFSITATWFRETFNLQGNEPWGPSCLPKFVYHEYIWLVLISSLPKETAHCGLALTLALFSHPPQGCVSLPHRLLILPGSVTLYMAAIPTFRPTSICLREPIQKLIQSYTVSRDISGRPADSSFRPDHLISPVPLSGCAHKCADCKRSACWDNWGKTPSAMWSLFWVAPWASVSLPQQPFILHDGYDQVTTTQCVIQAKWVVNMW